NTSLLYVSNLGTNDVTVYTYRNGGGLLLVGTLTGFSYPTGMCTDKVGNVWVPDAGSGAVYEFAHGGTSPIDTIRQTGNSRPYDCSVDLSTGKLAVANQSGGQFPNGNVKIYAKGSHSGVKYEAPHDAQVDFLAYDDKSDLFVDGTQATYGAGLYELPRGHHQFTTLTLSGGQLYSPGAIQWLNPTLLVGDAGQQGQGSPVADKIFVYGTTATILGVVSFANTQDTYGFWRRGKRIIVPDHLGNAVEMYALSNGAPISTLTTGISLPFGAVVSQSTR
ncbi:MAG TPA: hypothetical protein VGF86_02935, partial [Candidatus Tumulicola sp.]